MTYHPEISLDNKKAGRKVIAKIRRSLKPPKTAGNGATKTDLKENLKHVHPTALDHAMEAAGIKSMKAATADQLHELNYAMAWSLAWRKPIAEYYAEFGR